MQGLQGKVAIVAGGATGIGAATALRLAAEGAIVNTTSDGSHGGEPTRVAYACAKAGVNALTRHIASRWGKDNIRCNAVSPGAIMSETMQATMSDDLRAQILAAVRSSRFGRPTDIAGMVALLFSEDGDWINGQVLHVNGGSSFHD